MATQLVLPSQIPWRDLRGKELEEALFWLADAMGAKNLEWRLGGEGGGAADQGRDLEAYFYTPQPDGEIAPQKWWIQAKGRSRTVEPKAVKETVLDVGGRNDVDVLLIATNSTFSNPTRDWVKNWQHSNPRPVVRLWDRNDLERQLCQHPEVVVRLFAEALSAQGKLEVVRTRFWNYSFYSDEPTLRELWKGRSQIQWDEQMYLAALVSEIANGEITRRPWGVFIPTDLTLNVLGGGLLNLIPFCLRADRAGVDQRPYIRGIAYLVLVAIHRFSAGEVHHLLQSVWDRSSKQILPAEHRDIAISPVLDQLTVELLDVCGSDCVRVSPPGRLTWEQIEHYWERLRLPSTEGEDEKPEMDLIIEKLDEPCNVGFHVDANRPCPINYPSTEGGKYERLLEVLERIVRHRGPNRAAVETA